MNRLSILAAAVLLLPLAYAIGGINGVTVLGVVVTCAFIGSVVTHGEVR